MLSLATAPTAAQQSGTVEVARSEVIIAVGDARHRFAVEVARTPEQRARGLMFRTELAADAGMLFLFESAGPVSFWMKNTYLPLDMLFIDDAGVVIRVAADTTPLSLTPVPSGGPARAVLEVAAGTAARLGIAPGARVRSEAFPRAP